MGICVTLFLNYSNFESMEHQTKLRMTSDIWSINTNHSYFHLKSFCSAVVFWESWEFLQDQGWESNIVLPELMWFLQARWIWTSLFIWWLARSRLPRCSCPGERSWRPRTRETSWTTALRMGELHTHLSNIWILWCFPAYFPLSTWVTQISADE